MAATEELTFINMYFRALRSEHTTDRLIPRCHLFGWVKALKVNA